MGYSLNSLFHDSVPIISRNTITQKKGYGFLKYELVIFKQEYFFIFYIFVDNMGSFHRKEPVAFMENCAALCTIPMSKN